MPRANRLTRALRTSLPDERGAASVLSYLKPIDGIEDAKLSARRIADLVEQPFHLGDLVIPIRISVGAALLTPDIGLSLRQADDELYRDKPDRARRKRRPTVTPQITSTTRRTMTTSPSG